MEDLQKFIRDVPDFPKKGIVFKDITPLLASPKAFGQVIDIMAERFSGEKIDCLIGIESRGFIFGAALALKMKLGFVPVRKEGKLPWITHKEEYTLEYGSSKIEIHADALSPESRVLIVDDVLATGGTAEAVCRMVEKQNAKVSALAFLIELDFLKGREKLKKRDIFSLIHYE